ncbi:MAG: magnesium transporter, partial [Planctomycetota bacterium]
MPASIHDLDARDQLALKLWRIFTEDGPGGLTIAGSSLREADVAAALEALDPEQRFKVFLALPPDMQAEVLEELEPEFRDELLESTSDERLLAILATASTDDAVYFLDHLDSERAEHLIGKLSAHLRSRLEAQWELPEGCAGRIMVRRLIQMTPFNTVQSAIDRIRTSDSKQAYGAVYVVDTDGHLVGVVSLRELVFSKPSATLASIMTTDVLSVRIQDDEEEVARLMQRYHLYAIPVVDDDNLLRGMVTWDDAADILEAEVEEDILAVAGTGEDPEDNESIFGRARHRLPYLLITTLGGFVMAGMIEQLGGDLRKHAILIAFMPLIPALAGNVGIQCSTVTLRAIVNGELQPGTMRARAMREIATGILLAVVLSCACGLGALTMILTQATGEQLPAGIIPP